MEQQARQKPVLRQPGVVDFAQLFLAYSVVVARLTWARYTLTVCQYNLQASYSYVFSKTEATAKIKEGDVEEGVYDNAVCLSRTLVRSCARIFEFS
jgi:hypothetical protein